MIVKKFQLRTINEVFGESRMLLNIRSLPEGTVHAESTLPRQTELLLHNA